MEDGDDDALRGDALRGDATPRFEGRLPDLGAIAVGGALGSVMRYGLGLLLGSGHAVAGWPMGTLVANLVGAFLLGVLVEGLGRRGNDTGRLRTTRLFFGTGVLGGFTTYSMLSAEVAQMLIDGRFWSAFGYACTTLVVGGLASWGGILTARSVVPLSGRGAA